MSQITLGGDNSHGYDFVAVTGNSVHVCTFNCLNDIVGPAYYSGGPLGYSGQFTFGPAGFLAGPLNATGGFPTSAVETFEYHSLPSLDSLTGPVTWTLLDDNSLVPHLEGSLFVATSAGNAAFLADFPVGSTAFIDVSVKIECTLTNLVSGACPTNVQESTFSAGEILPRPVAMTEPSSLVIIIVALLFAAAGMQRRGRRV